MADSLWGASVKFTSHYYEINLRDWAIRLKSAYLKLQNEFWSGVCFVQKETQRTIVKRVKDKIMANFWSYCPTVKVNLAMVKSWSLMKNKLEIHQDLHIKMLDNFIIQLKKFQEG